MARAAASQTDWGKVLVDCVGSADAVALTRYFGGEAEVSVTGESGIMGPEATCRLLNGFFAEHAPRSCSISHQGTREASSFFILSYQDQRGDKYRIYCVVRKSDEGRFIKQFRIDYVR